MVDIAPGPNNMISQALIKGMKLTDILKNEGDSWGLGSGKYNSISLKRVKRLKTKKLETSEFNICWREILEILNYAVGRTPGKVVWLNASSVESSRLCLTNYKCQ